MLKFTPKAKRKGNRASRLEVVTPFPSRRKDNQRYIGVFTGISVEVLDKEAIKSIYGCGCYGKGSRSRSAPQILRTAKQENDETGHSEPNDEDESLSLDLEEALFLAYFLGVLQINDLDGNRLSWGPMLEACMKLKCTFTISLAAYLYLKSKNWVVKSGIKFGGDFLIYKKGPHLYHASFIVLVSSAGSPARMAPKDFKGLQRIAETSDKDVLLLEVTSSFKEALSARSSFKEIKHFRDFSKWSLTETIIRRFNYTSFSQNQKNQAHL